MLDSAQVDTLQRRKRSSLVFLIAVSSAFIVACLLRFIPCWNDLLAGRPPYAKAMTTLMAQEFGNVAQDRFPVILLGEDEHCEPVPPAQIADDQIAGILYALTYSERQHLSCITTYAVPVDPSKFANLRTFQPGEEWTAGPKIMGPMKVLSIARNLNVYSPAYLASLHWRVTPRFPISKDEAVHLAARQYESRNPAFPSDEQASISIDFAKARALVRQPHDKVNLWLSPVLTVLAICGLCVVLLLIDTYRKSSRYLQSYGESSTLLGFLTQDMNQMASAARTKYYERERERQDQQRKASEELVIRQDLEERLRSALGNLHDESLRQNIADCLNTQASNLYHMKRLWASVQESLGHKTPEEKLAFLLESLKPYCTEEELYACRAEAQLIIEGAGFRTARSYLVAMHAQFRLRMRETEAMEEKVVTDKDPHA